MSKRRLLGVIFIFLVSFLLKDVLIQAVAEVNMFGRFIASLMIIIGILATLYIIYIKCKEYLG